MVMEYADHRPLVYLQTETVSLFLEDAETVRRYRVILADLARVALDEGTIHGPTCPVGKRIRPTGSTP